MMHFIMQMLIRSIVGEQDRKQMFKESFRGKLIVKSCGEREVGDIQVERRWGGGDVVGVGTTWRCGERKQVLFPPCLVSTVLHHGDL